MVSTISSISLRAVRYPGGRIRPIISIKSFLGQAGTMALWTENKPRRSCTATRNRRACGNMPWQWRPAWRPNAGKFGGDPQVWSATALLHDFDYQIHPNAPDHPMKGSVILAELGVSEEIRRAILSHANYSGVPRETLLEKTLFACDELAGFITAVALVKPSKSLREVAAASVRKKMKDKAFARSVSREDIVNGAADLGVDLDEHIAFCIEAMQARAGELGLG